MTAAPRSAATTAGSVLRRSVLIWGLGDLALGRRRAALAWMAAEALSAAFLAYVVVGLTDTTLYLVPFLGGIAFLLAWTAQAVAAYRRALSLRGTTGPTPPRSPAANVAWLSLPLLVWGAGFWLVGASAASPAAVLDRFEASWPNLLQSGTRLQPNLATDPATTTDAATAALRNLGALCRDGELAADCADAPENLLRSVRFRIEAESGTTATAVAETVVYERHPTRFLGLISGTELVPVPRTQVLVIDLRAVAAPLPGGLEIGARRWQIVNAQAVAEVPST